MNRLSLILSLGAASLLSAAWLGAELRAEPPVSNSPYVKILASGKLPPERQGVVIGMICERGTADDMAYVFGQLTADDGYTGETRRATLKALIEAAEARELKPAGDLSALAKLFTLEDDRQAAEEAVRLAGLWRAESLAEPLQALIAAENTPADLREAAVASLGAIGGDAARESLQKLTAAEQPIRLRLWGAAGLAALDAAAAAEPAAATLAAASAEDDPAMLIDAFLGSQGGPQKLAAALAGQKLNEDVAKRALRHMYSIGRTDQALVDALSSAAGLAAEMPPPTAEEIKRLSKLVEETGNAARGEAVFRRADLSCLKCHAVSKAGGNIGPDLSAIGASSPVDYLVNSILQPELAVKEEYQMVVVETDEGKIYQGIVVDENDQVMILRNAEGKEFRVPQSEDNFVVKGGSLMPRGLVRFTTEQEFVDLVKFLAELGRPGPYAVRNKPTVQRWRLLKPVPEDLREAVPNEDTFQEAVLAAAESKWTPAYGKVGGQLPLAELAAEADSPVIYLYGEGAVTEPGGVGLRLSSTQGVQAWLNTRELPGGEEFQTDLEAGTHRVTVRVDTAEAADELIVEFFRPEGSSAQFEVLGGQ